MSLAKDLWSTYHRKLYVKWGFKTFDEYITKEVGISKDYARRMRRVFSVFVLKCGIRPNELDVIGRSKAHVLLPVVDKFNARNWLSTAKTSTYDELVTKVRAAKAASVEEVSEPTEPDSPLPGGDKPIKLSSSSPRAVSTKSSEFVRRTFRLPEDSDTILDEALAEAQRITKSASDGFNLTCIAQQFLQHRMTETGKKDGRLKWFMRNLEEVYGIRLLHIKSDKAWEVLEKLVEDKPTLFGTSAEENTGEQHNDGKDQEDEGEKAP